MDEGLLDDYLEGLFDDDLCDITSKDDKKDNSQEIHLHTLKTRQSHVMRRAFSEQAMNEALDWHLERGCTYHCISGGDVDSLTYLRGIVKQQKLDYALISTWCMSMTDAEEINTWIERGILGRIDLYVGEIFTRSYGDVMEYMQQVVAKCDGRVCVTRNHSKVMVGYGDDYAFAIASSANVNTNPRIENTTITVDKEVADFYKSFFDELIPFNGNPKGWEPYHA